MRKHFENKLSDVRLLNSDILCLTETQLNLDEDASAITSKFQGNFTMYFNSKRDWYKRIAIAYSSNMLPCSSTDYDSISFPTFKKPSYLEESLKIALFHRSSNSTKSPFLVNLK